MMFHHETVAERATILHDCRTNWCSSSIGHSATTSSKTRTIQPDDASRTETCLHVGCRPADVHVLQEV